MLHKLVLLAGLFFLLQPIGYSKVIAISYFDNTTGDVKYNSLSKGITDMLITDLSKVQGLTIVEREKLEKLIGEIKLGQSKYIDPKTAQQLGKGLGAEAILTGAYIIMGDQIRIDARLINVETSTVIMAEEVTGPTANFFQIHGALVKLLIANLKLTQQQASVLNVGYQPVNLATVVSYSEAIDNFDQGLTEEAVRTLEKTVKDNPGFIMAVDKLQQVRKNLIVLDKQREEQLAQKIEVILNNMNLDSVNWALQISNSWSILISTFSYEALLEFNAKLLEKGISPEKRMYGASMDIQFGEMMEMYNITAYSQLKRHEEVINHGQTYLARYPVSMYYTSVRMNVEQSLAELEAREAGAKKIDKVLQYDAFLAYASYLDKFEIYKENLSSAEMKNFTDLMQNQVIKYLEKTKVLTEDFDAYDLKDLFDACLKLEKPELASDLIKTAHSILDGTEDEEKAYDMEEELNDYNEEIKEKADKLANYKERYSKAIPEEIPPLLLHGHDIIDCGGFDLIDEISEKYLRGNDTRDTDNVVRSRHHAWFSLLSKAEKTNDIKEYEEILSRYKQDKFIQDQNFEWYSNELKSYEEDLRDLQAGRRAYIRDFAAYSPEKDMINRYAGSCSEYDQYVSAIKFRKQLMQNFKLTDEEKSMNYYFMVLAYNNLGKFDEARIFAKMLMNEIPESDYASAVKSLIDFMPR